jgi:subtilisin-like proprotein convertase family protein
MRGRALCSVVLTLAASTCGGVPDDLADPEGITQALASPPALELLEVVPLQEGDLVELDCCSPSDATNLDSVSRNTLLDFAHWGLTSTSSLNRSRGLRFIPNYTRTGTASTVRYTGPGPNFTWEWGTPTIYGSGTSTGVAVGGSSANGFNVALPVQAEFVRCTLFGQVRGAEGFLSVSLSDNSAPGVQTFISPSVGMFAAHFRYRGADAAVANMVWRVSRATTGQQIVLHGLTCGVEPQNLPPLLGLARNRTVVPYYAKSATTQTLRADFLPYRNDNYSEVRFYDTGTLIGTAPNPTGDPCPPQCTFTVQASVNTAGYRIFQTISRRASDGRLLRGGGVRVPVWTNAASFSARDIPDNNSTGTTHSTTISGLPSGQVVREMFVKLRITHIRDSDLVGKVLAPDGTTTYTMFKVGGDGDNFDNTIFLDDAEQHITQGTAPFVGIFRPEAPLGLLNGKTANATWRINISDLASGATGRWTGAELRILPN